MSFLQIIGLGKLTGIVSNWPTFPQLYRSGELVGGLDIVKEELEADPDFFADFSVGGKGKDGKAAVEPQVKPEISA